MTRGDPHEDFHRETVKVTGVIPTVRSYWTSAMPCPTASQAVTADDALANMRVIDAIHASAATGRRADVAT